MIKTAFTGLLLLATGFTTFAQEDIDTLRKSRCFLNDFTILPTMGISGFPYSDVNDFQKLAPNSILLSKDLSAYSHGDNSGIGHRRGMNGSMSPSLTLMAGLKFRGMEHSSLRIGIGYASGTNFSSDYTLETTSIYDTLISSKTAQKIYAQSSTIDRYSMKSSYEQLRLDVSYVLKAKLGRRFSFYTGLGATAGISFNNITEIQHTNHVYYDGYKDDTSITGTESFHTKDAAAFSTYIPLGLNFRLGHRREFFKRISIFAETRPTVNFINIPELKTYTFVSVQHGVGLKIKF
jgi:hypothetical protein